MSLKWHFNIHWTEMTVDAYTKALLLFKGVDHSTTFTDETSRVWTASGDAEIFNSLAYFPTGAGAIYTADSADFYFGANDFTIEYTVNFDVLPAGSSTALLYAQVDPLLNSAIALGITESSGTYYMVFVVSVAGAPIFVASDSFSPPVVGVWNTFTVAREGNNTRLFYNGTLLNTYTDIYLMPDISGSLIVGTGLQGWMGRFKVSKGIARWTASYTPPPYTDYTDEGQYAIDFSSSRGRDNLLRLGTDDKMVGFERVDIGTCNFTLLNDDGRFDPWNTTSPLYTYVMPGKLVQVTVEDLDTSTIYPVFTGSIKDIRPISGEINQVYITCEDGLRELGTSTMLNVLLYDINLHDAVDLVLSDAGWFLGSDISISTLDAPFLWFDNISHSTALFRLSAAGLGRFFIAADGKATFISYDTTLISLGTITQDYFLKEISVPQPWENNRDKIFVTAYPRTIDDGVPSVVLWELGEIPSVPAGETMTFWAKYIYNSQYVPADCDTSTVDFTFTGATGTVTITPYSNIAKVVVTNTDTSAGDIDVLKIYGWPLTSLNPVKMSAGTGSRVLEIDDEWTWSSGFAQNAANYLNYILAKMHRFPTVLLETQEPSAQYTPDLFNVITLNITKLKITGDFSISKIEHRWLSSNGQSVQTKLKLEEYANYPPPS